ncbi:hypothetical protein HGM15179_021574, partial [Zosterops borbonicus]
AAALGAAPEGGRGPPRGGPAPAQGGGGDALQPRAGQGAVCHRDLCHGGEHAGPDRRLRLHPQTRRERLPRPPARRVHADVGARRAPRAGQNRHRHHPVQGLRPRAVRPAPHDA